MPDVTETQITETEAVFNAIQAKAESLACADPRTIAVMDRGDYCRQGDVYVTLIDKLPDGATQIKEPVAQLAPGNTPGSRHCLRDLTGLKLYRVKDASELDGPIIVADSSFTIDHHGGEEKHGTRTFPAGIYAITYQRTASQERKRVQD
jgi:hypothetical protein